MNELDETWALKLNDALEKAKAAGRGDAAEYILLKAANDHVRSASVEWLIDSAAAIAREAVRRNARISIENESPHSFNLGHANIVGSQIRFTQGVRCLTIEAGWTRAPQDGFMRGGALACARISHFGISRENEDLLLLKENDSPGWFSTDTANNRKPFDSRDLQRHFQIFLSD